MKFNFLLVLLLIVSLTGSVFALSWNVCIDKQAPEAPSGLVVSDNVLLSWNEASDLPESTPDCTFGIEYYNIYLDGVLIGTSSDLSYSGDILSDGIYMFGVSGVDRAGNEGDRVVIKDVVFPLSVDDGDDNGGDTIRRSGGGGGSNNNDDEKSSNDSVVASSSPDGGSVASLNDDTDSASSEVEAKDEDVAEKGFFSFMTGAVIGGASAWTWAILFVLLILLFFFIVGKRKKKVIGPVGGKKK